LGPQQRVLPGVSGFDLLGMITATILLGIFIVQTWRTGRKLSAGDPAP